MKLVFTRTAEADLEQIADFIARDNPNRALTFVRERRAVARQLCDAPRAYPYVAQNEALGIRRRPYGRYLIFYRVQNDQIAVTRILHGARDVDFLLSPE